MMSRVANDVVIIRVLQKIQWKIVIFIIVDFHGSVVA